MKETLRGVLIGALIVAGFVAASAFADTIYLDKQVLNGGLQIEDTEVLTSVGFTVGSESSDTINVAVQLSDGTATDMAIRTCVPVYLSDDANGDSETGTAPDTTFAIGTDGLLIEWTSDKSGLACSESDGDIDVDVSDTGTPTFYLCVVLPHGEVTCSGAITFA